MKNLKLYLPDETIDITADQYYAVNVESATVEEWRYYMRRGNRYYFKNIWSGDKIKVLSPEFKTMSLKYGEIYELNYTLK